MCATGRSTSQRRTLLVSIISRGTLAPRAGEDGCIYGQALLDKRHGPLQVAAQQDMGLQPTLLSWSLVVPAVAHNRCVSKSLVCVARWRHTLAADVKDNFCSHITLLLRMLRAISLLHHGHSACITKTSQNDPWFVGTSDILSLHNDSSVGFTRSLEQVGLDEMRCSDVII